MRLVRSLCIAFAMFSRLPTPRVDWDRENMRYTMAVFPLVGLLVGVCAFVGWWVLNLFAFGSFCTGMALTVIPVLVTGGIHLDGYADTVDALASHGDQAKKLAILKDPHAGAFAIIKLCVYFLCFTALAVELVPTITSVITYCSVFILSRALGVIFMLTLAPARQDGLGRLFYDAATKRMTLMVALFFAFAVCIASMCVYGWTGAIFPASMLAALWYCHRMATREFGGVTGDLTGYCIQLCEIVGLAGIILGQHVPPALGVIV